MMMMMYDKLKWDYHFPLQLQGFLVFFFILRPRLKPKKGCFAKKKKKKKKKKTDWEMFENHPKNKMTRPVKID